MTGAQELGQTLTEQVGTLRRIRENERVFKYGEAIGRAVCDIPAGAHVHEHNIVSPGREGV